MKAPATDREVVEHLLDNLDERGPEEPYIFHLSYFNSRTSGDPAVKAGVRTLRQRARIRAKFNAWKREQGSDCAACGARFQPRTVRQRNCPDCIARSKTGGTR